MIYLPSENEVRRLITCNLWGPILCSISITSTLEFVCQEIRMQPLLEPQIVFSHLCACMDQKSEMQQLLRDAGRSVFYRQPTTNLMFSLSVCVHPESLWEGKFNQRANKCSSLKVCLRVSLDLTLQKKKHSALHGYVQNQSHCRARSNLHSCHFGLIYS